MDSVNSQNYNQFGYTLTRFLWVIPVIPDQIYNSIMHFFTIMGPHPSCVVLQFPGKKVEI